MRTVLAALALVLAGCGFMQVGERPIPSVAGSVAATAWQSQDPVLPGSPDDLPATSTPEAFLEQLVQTALGAGQVPAGGVRYGVLGRAGDEASAYLQIVDPQVLTRPIVAYEAHLTLVAGADGNWTLGAVEVREQCSEPLTGNICGDNSGGGGAAPEPAPTEPASP